MPKRTFELIYPKEVDDTRSVTSRQIKQMVENDTSKHKYPVALGHYSALGFWDDSQPAAGTVSNLRENEEGRLLGDVQLTNEIDEKYKQGAYPGWSVGMFKTKKYGWQFGHLALLGSTEAAFKDLSEITKDEKFSVSAYEENHMFFSQLPDGTTREPVEHWLFKIAPVEIDAQTYKNEVDLSTGGQTMTPEEIKALQEKAKLASDNYAAAKAENENLKADLDKFKKAEKEAAEQKFSKSVDLLKDEAKKLGISEESTKELFESIESLKENFVSGQIESKLLGAFESVLKEVQPKVKPGKEDLGDNDKDSAESYSSQEIADAID